MIKLMEKFYAKLDADIELAYATVLLGAMFCRGSAFMTSAVAN